MCSLSKSALGQRIDLVRNEYINQSINRVSVFFSVYIVVYREKKRVCLVMKSVKLCVMANAF